MGRVNGGTVSEGLKGKGLGSTYSTTSRRVPVVGVLVGIGHCQELHTNSTDGGG